MAGVGGIVNGEAVQPEQSVVEAFQSGQESQEGGLAGGVGPHHGHDLTGRNRQGQFQVQVAADKVTL
jgi:hypothetical protein